MDKLTTLIEAHSRATDIHITEGGPVFLREQGALYHIEPIPELLPELEAGLTAEKKTIWEQGGTIDGSFSAGGVRCRLHLYRSAGRKAAALRLLPALDHLPPDRDEPWMGRLSACRSGLILITGPAGSGKSTALARFVQILAERRATSSPSRTRRNMNFPPAGRSSISGRSARIPLPLPRAYGRRSGRTRTCSSLGKCVMRRPWPRR